ncbi:MAG: hypothetical protein R3E32_15915 [Chitinophagales bacterium]
MQPTINTVILFTNNMIRLHQFYQQGLELGEATYKKRNHIGYQLENHYFGFDEVSEKIVPTTSITVWFKVLDIYDTFDKLVTMGAREKMKPTKKQWGAVIAAVYDLDGNVLGLEQG